MQFTGAPTRTRTANLLITNQLLYQLSYRGQTIHLDYIHEIGKKKLTINIKLDNLISRKYCIH